MKNKKKGAGMIPGLIVLIIASVAWVLPILLVFMNSFKKNTFVKTATFAWPSGENAAGFDNYIKGVTFGNYPFGKSVMYSVTITILATLLILLFSSMAAWYITRVNNKFCKTMYYIFVFSMVVPFQMVMFTMSKLANMTHLNNPPGMVLLYLGFGSGLSVFMFCGFIKSIPLDIEEAAMIDGCNPLQTFFGVVMPILKPTAITVAILNAMWIWNDFLLPYLVIGISTKYKTIPVVVQMLVGSNGNKDMGALMAMLVLSIIPIVIFYMACQKYIIEGVVAGAVKG